MPTTNNRLTLTTKSRYTATQLVIMVRQGGPTAFSPSHPNNSWVTMLAREALRLSGENALDAIAQRLREDLAKLGLDPDGIAVDTWTSHADEARAWFATRT
jgi:hypothetical protein